MGLLWYSAKQFTVVLAEARLEDGRRRQLRRLRRLPAVERPVVGGGQRLRDPDRRHRRRRPHHRRGLQLQVRRHRRPRRGAEPAGGVEHLRDAGRGRAAPGLPQRREDQRLHQHRPGPLPGRATSASRTTAPATRSSFRNIRIKELGTTPTGNATIQAESFSSARRGRRVHQGRAPTAGRPSATSTRVTGPRTTGVNLTGVDHVPGPGRLRRRRAARSRSAPVRRPARSSARWRCRTPAAGRPSPTSSTTLSERPGRHRRTST